MSKYFLISQEDLTEFFKEEAVRNCNVIWNCINKIGKKVNLSDKRIEIRVGNKVYRVEPEPDIIKSEKEAKERRLKKMESSARRMGKTLKKK